MQQDSNNLSKTQKEIHRQIKFIYEHLIKIGYPKILQLSLTNVSQVQFYLGSYFQSTPSRMQLIQWLIAIIFPQYRDMPWFITQKDHVIKIIKCLWKVGVMPVNKHTKNLDYKKYVQATLGYQNAVSLIYNLVELAYETVLSKKAKNDVSFGQFFHQLIDNFTQLVNQNYDVYGITFPNKFINSNQTKQVSENDVENEEFMSEFQKQFEQFYAEKMIPLLQKQDQLFDKIYAKSNKKNAVQQLNLSQNKKPKKNDQSNELNQLQKFVDELSKYGSQYKQKYNKLVNKIDELLSAPQTKSRLIPYIMQKKQQKQFHQSQISIKESVENRSIRITPQFCKKYMAYKKILKNIKHSKDDQQFMNQRTILLKQIQKINEQISI